MQRWICHLLIATAGWFSPIQCGWGQNAPDAGDLLRRAEQAASRDASQQAVELATQALGQDPTLADAYYLRGRERFRSGDFTGSLADFDRFIEQRPEAKSRLWERGISCYYAKRYQDGADQFAAYQDFDDSDVENAVWHLACLSQIRGLHEARRQLMPVKSDARVPMATIYRLFRGDGTVNDVFDEVADGARSESQRQTALFYAHLYVGLFYDASGDPQLARKHLTQAANDFRVPHYMWYVARVHAARWGSEKR